MKLSDLDAKFLRWDEGPHIKIVDSLAEANGISFLCPKCFAANGGAAGTHSVLCWFTGVPLSPHLVGPGRWNPAGTGLHDLAFVPPGAVSVLLKSGCGWHGYVRNGDAA